ETAFQSVQWDILLHFEKHGELVAIAAQTLGFEKLGDALMQPGRAASARELSDEGVRQLMFQNACQFRRYRTQAAHRDAQLAVVHRSRPGRSVSHIEERLLGV